MKTIRQVLNEAAQTVYEAVLTGSLESHLVKHKIEYETLSDSKSLLPMFSVVSDDGTYVLQHDTVQQFKIRMLRDRSWTYVSYDQLDSLRTSLDLAKLYDNN